MNRGKMYYVPDYYAEVWNEEQPPMPPGAIDTTGMEILSFHLISQMVGVTGPVSLVLKGSNNGDNIGGMFGGEMVDITPFKTEGDVTLSDQTAQIPHDGKGIVFYKELPRFVMPYFSTSFAPGEGEISGLWKAHVHGWVI